jgi:sugar phosphate isomerase/epimerase
LAGQIAALQSFDISHIELRFIDGKNVADLTPQEAKQVKSKLDAGGIRVSAVGSPLGKINLADDFAAHLEKARQVFETAAILQTDKIRMFSFFDAYDKKEQVFDYLARMVKLAEGYGVKLCHENEKKVYGDSLERVQELMANVPGLKFVYDPANYIQCNEKAEHSLRTLHDSTLYFHIKDVIFETQELVPAGYGDGNIPGLVEMIQDDKVLTLEPHLKAFAGLKDEVSIQYDEEAAYKDNNEAFDAGVAALKKILDEEGLSYE